MTDNVNSEAEALARQLLGGESPQMRSASMRAVIGVLVKWLQAANQRAKQAENALHDRSSWRVRYHDMKRTMMERVANERNAADAALEAAKREYREKLREVKEKAEANVRALEDRLSVAGEQLDGMQVLLQREIAELQGQFQKFQEEHALLQKKYHAAICARNAQALLVGAIQNAAEADAELQKFDGLKRVHGKVVHEEDEAE